VKLCKKASNIDLADCEKRCADLISELEKIQKDLGPKGKLYCEDKEVEEWKSREQERMEKMGKGGKEEKEEGKEETKGGKEDADTGKESDSAEDEASRKRDTKIRFFIWMSHFVENNMPKATQLKEKMNQLNKQTIAKVNVMWGEAGKRNTIAKVNVMWGEDGKRKLDWNKVNN
jgi:hypothetical protein